MHCQTAHQERRVILSDRARSARKSRDLRLLLGFPQRGTHDLPHAVLFQGVASVMPKLHLASRRALAHGGSSGLQAAEVAAHNRSGLQARTGSQPCNRASLNSASNRASRNMVLYQGTALAVPQTLSFQRRALAPAIFRARKIRFFTKLSSRAESAANNGPSLAGRGKTRSSECLERARIHPCRYGRHNESGFSPRRLPFTPQDH
jgi:hypothetical protein